MLRVKGKNSVSTLQDKSRFRRAITFACQLLASRGITGVNAEILRKAKFNEIEVILLPLILPARFTTPKLINFFDS
jgi:hypothetical protein